MQSFFEDYLERSERHYNNFQITISGQPVEALDWVEAHRAASQPRTNYPSIVGSTSKFMRRISLANLSGLFTGGLLILALLSCFTLIAAQDDEAGTADESDGITEIIGTISGQVINGTAGSEPPANLGTVLHIIDAEFNEETFDTLTDDAGLYIFEDVVLRPDWRYFVTVFYQDGFYISEIVEGSESSALDLPVTVYDLTDDPSVVTITLLITQITQMADHLEVVQITNFTNNSDRLYITDEVVDSFRQASLGIPLPPEAQNVSFNSPQRFVIADDGQSVLDTQPLFPGDSQTAHLIYQLPLVSDPISLDYPLEYKLNGMVQVVVSDGLLVENDQLAAESAEDDGFTTYAATLQLDSGSLITSSIIQAGDSTIGQITVVAIITAVVVFGVGASVILYLRRPASSGKEIAADQDELVAAIGELDRQFEVGEIAEAEYHRRRDELKAQLVKRMQGDN